MAVQLKGSINVTFRFLRILGELLGGSTVQWMRVVGDKRLRTKGQKNLGKLGATGVLR